MAEKQNLVEEALIQMKSLENVVAENAKGILASTMKEEISELVKESLTETEEDSNLDLDMSYGQDLEEADDDDLEFDDMDDIEDDEDMDDNMSMDDTDEFDSDDEFEFGSDDDSLVDLTNASDEEILKVFKAMGDEDGIIVKKDGGTIDLEDSNDDVHYKISMGEQNLTRGGEPFDFNSDEVEEDMMYEISLEDDMEDDWSEIDMDFSDEDDVNSDEFSFNLDDDSDDDFLSSFNDFEEEGDGEEEEIVYEIEMDDKDEDIFAVEEEWSEEADIEKMETKEGFKAKGVGMGKPKFGYKKTTGGFKENMKHGNPTKGTGKPKFEFKEEDEMEPTKMGGETGEASRTLGTGKYFGKKGLPKPKAAPQHLRVESVNNKELQVLRERNEEYRKALNVFRTKLNEVAVFNSNLAYATRLFTEHSTTKQEKINILRRFDSVESLKESKSLYKTIKDELGNQGSATVVKESLQEKIERSPASGSAVNLMESKTYENPQFLRMKDLMTKMNVVK
jgi:quinol monooxygenase YgiN